MPAVLLLLLCQTAHLMRRAVPASPQRRTTRPALLAVRIMMPVLLGAENSMVESSTSSLLGASTTSVAISTGRLCSAASSCAAVVIGAAAVPGLAALPAVALARCWQLASGASTCGTAGAAA
jgi:hypothetical protein